MDITKFWLLLTALINITTAFSGEFKDISYGIDQRQVFDIFTPSSTKKTPLIVYIHGGGFWNGSKDEITSHTSLIKKILGSKIAFAAINYRFLKTTPLQTIMKEDIAGFIQFIKYHAKKYNINKKKIMVYGESAGGSAALWLATHPDLRKLLSKNPIKRQSSRVMAIAHINAQLSYDFIDWYNFYGEKRVRGWMKNQMFSRYHFKNYDELFSEKGQRIRSELNMFKNMSSDDPPMLFWNGLRDNIDKDYNHFIHSPQHAINLHRRALELGITSEIRLKKRFIPLTGKHTSVLSFFQKILDK